MPGKAKQIVISSRIYAAPNRFQSLWHAWREFGTSDH